MRLKGRCDKDRKVSTKWATLTEFVMKNPQFVNCETALSVHHITASLSLCAADLFLCVHAAGLHDGNTLRWKFHRGRTHRHQAFPQWVCGLWEAVRAEGQQARWTWRNHRRPTTVDLCEWAEQLQNVMPYKRLLNGSNIMSCVPWRLILQVRSEIISTYALCGFANFSSLGIVIGGLCGYLTVASPFGVIISLATSDQSVFSPIKPPYVLPEEVTSHPWWWEPWSPALVCLSSTLALRVRDFVICLGCLYSPKSLQTTSWNTELVFNWTCSPRAPVSSSCWLCGFVLGIGLQYHQFWCDDLLCRPFPKVSVHLISRVGLTSQRYLRPNDLNMLFSRSTVRNRTISFEGSWSNVTNVTSYLWSCCDCCASPTVDVCL